MDGSFEFLFTSGELDNVDFLELGLSSDSACGVTVPGLLRVL